MNIKKASLIIVSLALAFSPGITFSDGPIFLVPNTPEVPTAPPAPAACESFSITNKTSYVVYVDLSPTVAGSDERLVDHRTTPNQEVKLCRFSDVILDMDHNLNLAGIQLATFNLKKGKSYNIVNSVQPGILTITAN